MLGAKGGRCVASRMSSRDNSRLNPACEGLERQIPITCFHSLGKRSRRTNRHELESRIQQTKQLV
jgi:hypothetical protein